MEPNHHLMTDFPFEQAMNVLDALKDCPDDNARMNVIRDALREGYNWRGVAYYLADCHAATLENTPKSTSKSKLERLRSICEKAAQAMRHAGYIGLTYTERYNRPEGRIATQERCEEAAVKPDAK